MSKEYLYIQIIEFIMKAIEENKYNQSTRLPTEAELSEKFNVSRITAKKAMDELASRGIIIRHRRLGSFVNSNYNIATGEIESIDKTAAGPSNQSTTKKLISLLLPTDTNMGDMMLYVNGVHDYITPRGYYLIISNSNRNSDKEKQMILKFISDKVSGIIYYPISDRHNFGVMTKLNFDNYPIVLLDKFFTGIDIPYVISDSFNGAFMITEYLIKMGHVKIAFFSESDISEFSTIRERFSGYCDCLKKHRRDIDTSIIYENFLPDLNASSEEYMNSLIPIIKKAISNGVTAIFCPSDGMALNAIYACTTLGVNVPDDLSITGFDDLSGTGQVSVPITTVRQDLYEMGHEAAKTLVRMIEGKQYKKKVVHPVKLVIRSSVKALNSITLI